MSQERYREWAAEQAGLQLFAQPRWLDLLGDDWNAAFHHAGGKLRCVWPYLPTRRHGTRIALSPPCTPYLGPMLTTDRVEAPLLPPGVAYVSCTFDDPSLAWHFGRRARAMSTQRISLPLVSLKKDVKRRLRTGEDRYDIMPAASESITRGLSHAREYWPTPLPSQCEGIFPAAEAGGFGTVLVASEQSTGQVVGYSGVVWDERTAFGLFTIKAPSAGAEVAPMLHAASVEFATEQGCKTYDFCSGYLPGVRDFFTRFGAQPSWYGQYRSGKGLWRAAEFVKSRTANNRL